MRCSWLALKFSILRFDFVFLVFIFFVLIQRNTLANDQQDVIWPLFDSPPSIIVNGQFKQQGNVDLLMSFFEERIDDYNFKLQSMNFKRFFYYSNSKEKTVCAIGATKTIERQKLFYFSLPTTIELAPVLVVNKSEVSRFKVLKSGLLTSVSLKNVLNTPTLNGLFVSGRSYTEEADKLISTHSGKNIEFKPLKDNQLLAMLINRRMDYFIHNPAVINYLSIEQKNQDQIISLTIDEIKPYTLGYTICNKTEAGKSIIKKISKILENESETPQYLAILEKWLDERSVLLLREYYKQEFFKQ